MGRGTRIRSFSRRVCARHAPGWWTNSCFLMCRDGARAAKRGKKRERGDGAGGGGWRGAKQQSKPCRATTVARVSLFTNRRSRCCFNVACPTSVALLLLLNRTCLLFSLEFRDERKKPKTWWSLKYQLVGGTEEEVKVEEVIRRKRRFLCCSN